MMPDFQDQRVALVTGGATGIGAACCLALAQEGFSLVVHYNSSETQALAVVENLPKAQSHRLMQANLAETDQIDGLIKNLREGPGRVDVLVNNAFLTRDRPMPTMPIADYDALSSMERGTWYLTKMILRKFMLRQKQGRIINISSVVGERGNAGQVPYAMAKAGLDAMTKSLALELRGTGILVNSVAPGFIETAMTDHIPDELRADYLRKIPLERLGKPSEVAELVAFLATKGSYIQGAIIPVNGGMTCG